MIISFFSALEDCEHLSTVEAPSVPNKGETVFISGVEETKEYSVYRRTWTVGKYQDSDTILAEVFLIEDHQPLQ